MPDLGLPGGTSGKEPALQGRRCKRHGFNPWSKQRQLAPVFLCLKNSMDRRTDGLQSMGCKVSDMTKHIAQCQI